jgi:Phage tail assembly chaperone proteins, E, or 41 or 14
MTLDILRRTGGWCVELQYPLKHHSGDITSIEIRPPTADHVIRWGSYEIESMLALLSRLCDLPENLLRQLPTADFDRVMFAFMNVVGPSIKADIEGGKRSLATADAELPESERVPVPDQKDPRFPAIDGPVVRLAEKKPAPPPEDQPMNLGPPRQATEAVR